MNFGGKIQRIGIQRAFVTYIYNSVMYKKQSYSQFPSYFSTLERISKTTLLQIRKQQKDKDLLTGEKFYKIALA